MLACVQMYKTFDVLFLCIEHKSDFEKLHENENFINIFFSFLNLEKIKYLVTYSFINIA